MEQNWATGEKFIGAAFVNVPSMRYLPSGFCRDLEFRMTEQNIIVNSSGSLGSRVNRLDIFNWWSLGKKSVGENFYIIHKFRIT